MIRAGARVTLARMTLLAIVLALFAPAAPGDLYRCAAPDGKAVFQDKPCAGQPKASTRLQGGTSAAGNPRALREWLQQLRREASTAPARAGATPRRGTFAPASPAPVTGDVDRRLLSVCSGRFLDCASDDAAKMDACIARTPVCAAGRGGGCCPRACVTRYQSLRAGGAPLATAVQRALLDPAQESCTVATR